MSEIETPLVSAQNHLAELIRDFTLEWLAIIFPGFVFLFASLPSVLLPVFWLGIVVDGWINGLTYPPNFLSVFQNITNQVENYSFLFGTLIISISYILGHFMFRRDPKIPDQKSYVKIHTLDIGLFKSVFRWVLRLFGIDLKFPLIVFNNPKDGLTDSKDIEGDPKDASIVEAKINDIRNKYINNYKGKPLSWVQRTLRWICTTRLMMAPVVKRRNDFDGMVMPSKKESEPFLEDVLVEFPYLHLRNYLKKREFNKLEEMVYWGEDDTGGRSKYFINLLKANIEFFLPREYRVMQKNEAHIRLASSTWYAANFTRSFSLLGIAIGILTEYLVMSKWHVFHSFLIFTPMITLILSVVAQYSVEYSLHYQRCREIMYVMQFANLGSIDDPRLLYGLHRERRHEA
jgi:hypothetical protein